MTQRHPSPLELLERVLRIDALDFRTALTELADVIASAMGADKVDLFVHDADADALVALGTSNTPMGRRQVALGLDRLPLGAGGRAAAVYRSNEAYATPDSRRDPLELRAMTEDLGVRATVMIPVAIEGEDRRAVLAVCWAEPARFDEEDVAFLRSASRWIGLVAHRASLAERVAASAREEGRRHAAEELITVVAHDLRNFLGPAVGRVQLIRRRAERESRASDARDAQAAERALWRVTRLVGDLLDVARIDRGLFELDAMSVDLVALVHEVADAVAEPGKAVEVRMPEDAVISADPSRLRQAFENLVSNALKFAPSGTSVTISGRTTRERTPAVEIEVLNEGPVVPAELAPRVFERFARGAGSQGLGLGLYLAREIIRAHGGEVALDATVTSGARFVVTLPLR